jgi:pyruvate formate lyase activating enzyme
MPTGISLKTVLEDNTAAAAADLVQPAGDAVRCLACGHRCVVKDGRQGVCRVRFNRDGELRVPFGYVSGVAVDPIEKKPFFHAFPGATALSFGMLGCDFHCSYCQNWISSQTLRNDRATAPPNFLSAEDIVRLAAQHHCRVLTSTYNEPLITAEWAVEIFKLGRQAGLVGSFVSNGNATPEVLEYIRPYVDLYKVDLKSFDDRTYRELGGVLQNVLDTIRRLKEMDFWVEIVTLLVPGLNDGEAEIRQIADFIASVSCDIPWHVTAFHPDYQMTDTRRTRPTELIEACEIGRSAGLRFVYAGNLPGAVGDLEHTNCPDCGERLIERRGMGTTRKRVENGKCFACGCAIPGVWD